MVQLLLVIVTALFDGPVVVDEEPAALDQKQVQALSVQWESMTQEERQQWVENLERWRAMSEEERKVMAHRYRALDDIRQQVDEALPAETRNRLSKMNERERQEAMRRHTYDLLRTVKDLLTPEMQEKIAAETKDMPRNQRLARKIELVNTEVERLIPDVLHNLVDNGALREDQEELVQARFLEENAIGRFRILRQLMLQAPEEFGVSPEAQQDLEREEHPIRALRVAGQMRQVKMSRQQIRHYLEREGVPQEELDSLFVTPTDQFDGELKRVLKRYSVISPVRLIKLLRSRGAPQEELRSILEGSDDETFDRLRRLRERFQIRRPPAPSGNENSQSPSSGEAPANCQNALFEPEGRSGRNPTGHR